MIFLPVNNSLMNKNKGKKPDGKEHDLPGYPLYPPNEDIYNKGKRDETIQPDLDPEITDVKAGIGGDELDVPGSELDDEQEAIGNEDEENNYYSIGGDNHDLLEENDAELPQ